MSINNESPTPAAGMEDTNHTLAASTPCSGHTASADEPNAANMPDGLDSSSFFTSPTNFEDTSDPFPPLMQSNSVSQYFAESEARPDTASPHTLATQTPIPAHLLVAANTPVFQPESSSTILAQSGLLVNTSSPHTLAAQTPAPARTTFTQVEPRFSQPSTPQPRGSHGPIRTARQQYDRSQPYPTPTRMQPPANVQGQHSHQPQISMTGSPQKQQPGHGQLHSSSHQGIMQPVGVNGGQDYQQFNGHMNDHPQMQLMAYGSEPQTFTGPQNHSNSFAQMTEQNSTQQAREQQQSALQKLQQRAGSPVVWSHVTLRDLTWSMRRLVLQHAFLCRKMFKEYLKEYHPALFARCTRIRFKADYVTRFSTACVFCRSPNIKSASETRKHKLISNMAHQRLVEAWGTELWHYCPACGGLWNIFSVAHCIFWGEYRPQGMIRGPDPNALQPPEPIQVPTQGAIQTQQSIQQSTQGAVQPRQIAQEPAQNAFQNQQSTQMPIQAAGNASQRTALEQLRQQAILTPIQLRNRQQPQETTQEPTRDVTKGMMQETTQEPTRDVTKGMMQETTREQLEDGIDLSQFFQTQDTAQGLNLESNSFSFEGLFQQQGPFQEYDEQQTREQALSRSATPTAAGIRDSWQSVAREWDEEADQDTAEGSTQAPEPCRFQDFLRNQKSVAEEPPKETEELEQDAIKDATKKPTPYPTPPCSIVATPSV